jgi:hypothetical protein
MYGALRARLVQERDVQGRQPLTAHRIAAHTLEGALQVWRKFDVNALITGGLEGRLPAPLRLADRAIDNLLRRHRTREKYFPDLDRLAELGGPLAPRGLTA